MSSENGGSTDPFQQKLQELQQFLEQLSAQSQQAWERLRAMEELQSNPEVQTARAQLIDALKPGSLNSCGELRQRIQPYLTEPRLSHSQWEALLASIPGAKDRALLSCALYSLVQPEVQPGSVAPPVGIPSISIQSYGRSGLPLILALPDPEAGATGINVEASANLVSGLVALEIASSTLTGVLQFLGGSAVRKLRQLDLKLRQTVVNETEAAGSGPIEDPFLSLTQSGIQATQLVEFTATRIQNTLRGGLTTLPPLLPYQPLLEVVRLLTSDPVVTLSNLAEFSLESLNTNRRIELLIQMLAQTGQIPSPEEFEAAVPLVLAQVDQTLRPVLAQQLVSLTVILDPQERTDWINNWGRQWNQWNPLQYLQGWVNQDWLMGLREKLLLLHQSYPQLSLLQDYAEGLSRAQQLPRLMDQADVLRETAVVLDPSMAALL